MRVLIIDNYDSFTYNLYQYVGELLEISGLKFRDSNIDVVRNDKISIVEIKKRKYDRIVISPGPGNPANKAYFGVCSQILLDVGKYIPVLGVCLGMQGMAYYFGGKVVKALRPMHGKSSIVIHDEKGIFKGLPQNIEVMRYHSLVADRNSLPQSLKITAISEDTKEIMGLRHKEYPVEGIQFHPESFATEGGRIILSNFLFQQKLSRNSVKEDFKEDLGRKIMS